jgi:gliding motility-associated protein GldL
MAQTNFLFDVLMPKVYGIGAAVVIIGALFKIMHWPGADIALIGGLGTEAVIFFLSAFQPQHKEPDWSKVYPQLAEDFDGEDEEPATSDSAVGKLGEMMSSANLNQDAFTKLGTGIQSLNSTVSKIGDIADASVASNEFASTVRSATGTMKTMNEAYSKAADAMSGMANASTDAQAYHAQVQNITKNLGALNAVYEMELQDANNHLRAMNKFYANLSTAMDNMSEASKDTQQFKDELAKLSKNLTQLNNVYGNMLSAMKG